LGYINLFGISSLKTWTWHRYMMVRLRLKISRGHLICRLRYTIGMRRSRRLFSKVIWGVKRKTFTMRLLQRKLWRMFLMAWNWGARFSRNGNMAILLTFWEVSIEYMVKLFLSCLFCFSLSSLYIKKLCRE
jgi:hypothetical protein